MKKDLHITALIDQPDLLEDMVEKLACRRVDGGFGAKNVGTWQMVDTSSVEKYVSGTVEYKSGNELIRMPFITAFIFSCTKERKDIYKLNWSMSLS